MDIPRELRMELNALSKEVFGVSSRWQKLLKKGTMELVTRKTTEVVPAKTADNNGVTEILEPETTKEVEVPVLTPYGAKVFVPKNYTLEEIHTLLLGYKKQIDEIKATMKLQEEEKKAKEALETAGKAVREAAQGSAVS